MKSFVLTSHKPPGVGPLVADLRCLLRQRGLRAATTEIVSRTSARVRAVVYSREIDLVMVKTLEPSPGDASEAAAPSRSPHAGVRLERIAHDHAAELARLRGGAASAGARRAVLDNLRAGYQGFLVRRDDEVLGCFWWIDKHIAPAHPDLTTFRIRLADDEVYGFQNFLAQEHRGGGLATDALLAMEAELAKLGYKRIWGFVEAGNTPARWLYLMSGWTVSHSVTRGRLLGIRRSTLVPSRNDRR